MKLSALIAAHGDETIQFQNLDKCLVAVELSAKRNGLTTTIEFGTEQGIDPVNGTTDRLGLIVWLDRKKVARIMQGEIGDDA